MNFSARKTYPFILAIVACGIALWVARADSPTNEKFVVHEWGTFTTVAGEDGAALEWRPFVAENDLPSFVYDIGLGNDERGGKYRFLPGLKASMETVVRMETPVLYFYAKREMEVSVSVQFPNGTITEWYPRARTVDNSAINWGKFKLIPNADIAFPVEKGKSHYYAARETDATPLRICHQFGDKAEYEKFLFYRGAGKFDLPLTVKLEGEKLRLEPVKNATITKAIVFENRNGKIGYRVVGSVSSETSVKRPSFNNGLNELLADFQKILVAEGLYEKEAQAMIETWRDSWFEEGLRVFYILPNETTDAVLPLTITPKPAELVRVMVGRIECITPEMEQEITAIIAKLGDEPSFTSHNASKELHKYGRFAEPAMKRILAKTTDTEVKARIGELLRRSLK